MKEVLEPVLNVLLFPLSRLFPRSPRRWAFGHIGGTFEGNPKFLFLWLSLHRPDLSIVWITGDRATIRLLHAHGYPVRRRWSAGGIWAALRARVFVVAHGPDNVNLPLSSGALLINLWHGVGLKPIQYGDPNGAVVRARRRARGRAFGYLRELKFLRSPDALITTSAFTRAHFAQQCELAEENCPALGYPRLDCATDPQLRAAAEALEPADRPCFDATETYIYMPTFRDGEGDFLADAIPDYARLSAVLAARGAVLYVKLHPRTAAVLPADWPNIRPWPKHADFQTYLARFTGLLTDYSSVLYDYLYLKPTGAILYTFDEARYRRDDRALLYDFDANTAGTRAASFDELCDVLADGRALQPDASGQLARVRERFWGTAHGPAAPAIVHYVEERLQARDG